MKRDWLNIFLPVWVIGTIVWITVGFILLPVAYRKTLLYSPNAVWTTTLFDLTLVNMEVARALAIVIGPPVVAAFLALAVATAEYIWGPRREHERKR